MAIPRLAKADGLSFRPRSIRRAQPTAFHVKHLGRAPAPTQPGLARGRQPLVGIVGPQPQPVFGPRGEHAVGLGDARGHQIVNQNAEIAIGTIDDAAGLG